MEMSEEARFGTIDSNSTNNDFVLSLNEQSLTRMRNNEKKGLVKKLNLGQPNQEHIPSSGRVTSLSSSKCTFHKEEDLQFYCFNKDKLLCPECLVTGRYAGYEVTNLKKAAEKLKNKFSSLVIEAVDNFEAYSLIEEEIESHEDEIEKAALNFEETVSKQMTEIRQKIDKKEQELLQSIHTARQERLTELKSSTKWLHDYREEIESVKYTEKDEFKSLSDMELCKYYSKKTNTIKNLINGESNFKTNGIKEMIEAYQLQDQLALSKVQEECKALKTQLDSLIGLESGKAKLAPPTVSSTKETFRAIGASYFLPNPDVVLNNGRKDSWESVIQRNVTPSKLTIPKSSFLPRQVLEEKDNVELNSLIRNPSNRTLEKHLTKVLEIRKPTPKKEVVIESRYGSKDSKRSDARGALLIEMKRENSSKRSNRSGLSFQDTSSILESYKDLLTKRAGGIDSRTPKTYMLSVNVNSPPSKPFSSLLSSPNNLLATPSIKSSISPKVESREKTRTSQAVKSSYDIFTSELSKSSIKAFMRESDSSQNLNTEKMFAKRKAAERIELTSASDIGLRRKLDQLSSELFK